jgi:Tfp pilus assembly protein PilE
MAGRIDDVKLPEEGLYAVCPKCKERFLVKREPAPEAHRKLQNTASPAAETASDLRLDVSQEHGYAAEESPVRQTSPRSTWQEPVQASPADDIDWRTFIGRNADKYLEKFTAFTKWGRDDFALTWHWPAFFVPFWWMIYRKLYLWALLTFVISFIPFVGIIAMFIFGMTGNYLYYKYARKKVAEIRLMPSDMQRAVEFARAGGVNNIALVLVPLVGIAIIGILAAIAIPQFAAYRTKGYNAAALAELNTARTYYESYYADNKVYPDSLDQARYVKKADIAVTLNRTAPDKYIIVATHQRGNKEFAASSDSPEFLSREKNGSRSDFVPLK